ncbi:HAD-IC family P-type ATPase, partial [Mycobacterium intracellulare]|uniref:HAD-IC family P-type ATPase n=1 Tax=Mycobacterium intracellulare TaxID=1767 RepID=UPI000A5D1EB8
MLTTDTCADAGVTLKVVSDASGRMRVQATGFEFDAVRAVAIEDTVGKVTGVRAVYAYPRTASVVVWYSRARCNTTEILSAIAEAEHIPAASVSARSPHSADGGKAGVMQRILDWSARVRSGSCGDGLGRARAGVAAQPAGALSDGCCDHDDNAPEPERLWHVVKLRRAALSGALLAASVITVWVTPLGPVALGLKALALAVGASTFAPSAVKRLAQGRIGVGTLMTIAAAGAVALGAVGEAATLAFLFSISEGLEEYAVARTRRGLRALLSLVPEQATVLREGTETVVATADLRVGDQMIVKPGERLATDGIIRAGRTALDVSAITGESVPVEAGPGDEVFAGSINGAGVLQVEVTATAADNSLARIVHIVEAEQARKGASQRLADRIARPLVPGIMVAGVLIAGIGSVFGSPLVWIERALVVLVAASPCALAIAVPVSVVAAIGAGVAARTAAARGCSLRASSAAATARTSSRVAPLAVATSMTVGRLAVNVPVLSRAIPPIVPRVSSAAPPLMSTPSLEAAPMAATTDTGTAMASAHGEAATSTT